MMRTQKNQKEDVSVQKSQTECIIKFKTRMVLTKISLK